MNDLPGLRIPERFGVFLWWPQNGTDWIHPDDVELASELIPGNRIFQRDNLDNVYSKLTYGDLCLRVKPTMWLEVATDGYLVGDRVEIRSRMGKRKPDIATISHMLWNRQRGSVEYLLTVNDNQLPESFSAEDFQPAFELNQPMDVRQAELAAKSRLS